MLSMQTSKVNEHFEDSTSPGKLAGPRQTTVPSMRLPKSSGAAARRLARSVRIGRGLGWASVSKGEEVRFSGRCRPECRGGWSPALRINVEKRLVLRGPHPKKPSLLTPDRESARLGRLDSVLAGRHLSLPQGGVDESPASCAHLNVQVFLAGQLVISPPQDLPDCLQLDRQTGSLRHETSSGSLCPPSPKTCALVPDFSLYARSPRRLAWNLSSVLR